MTYTDLRLDMHIYGLTGGIATGKSTVSRALGDLGCHIIDADVIAREGKCSISTSCCAGHTLSISEA